MEHSLRNVSLFVSSKDIFTFFTFNFISVQHVPQIKGSFRMRYAFLHTPGFVFLRCIKALWMGPVSVHCSGVNNCLKNIRVFIVLFSEKK